MTVPDLQILAQVFTARLLNTAAEGFVLVALVWVLLRLIGRQNSGTRFAIWFSVLLAIVALPFCTWSGFGALHSPTLPSAVLHPGIIVSSSGALYLFAAWGTGAGLLLLRLSVGLWRLRHLRRNCSAVDIVSLDPAIAGILRDLGSRRRVKLCVSSGLAVPAAIGFFRPAIVFPAWLLPLLSAGELKVIVLHELAHLGRWDDWTNLAQKIVKAVFFFHPAVWWIENRLTLEREMACDDIVLAQTASPRAYASSLISFAEKLQSTRSMALAQALVSRMRHMSLRVTQILDSKRPLHTGVWKPVLGVSAGVLALAFTAAPYVPRFVAFGRQPEQSQTQLVQVAEQSKKNGAHSVRLAAELSHGIAPSMVPSPSVALPPRATLANFEPRAAAVAVPLKTTSLGKPAVIRARAERREAPIQETLVVLQTRQYGASDSGVWTLCIWRVERGNLAEKQLQSAIVLDSL